MSDNMGRSYVGPLLLGLAITGATGMCLYLLLRKNEDWDNDLESGLTSRQVAYDVKIPKDLVGIVIGRQGSNIREIQAKTETRIYFKDELETDEFRVACIRGLPDDAQKAEILIQQTISQQPRVDSLVLYVPGRAVGRIIGRGGESVRELQKVSRCKVDVDRGILPEGAKKKIVLKGTSDQINMAKKLIEDKVKEDDELRSGIGSRQARIKYKEPLFLNYEESDHSEPTSLQGVQEQLKPSSSDNCMEVLISSISTPGAFWVQKVGPESAELDKLTQKMSEYYREEENQELHRVSNVSSGEVVASKFGSEDNYYRARVVSVKEDSYDLSQSIVEVDFVDFGDAEEKHLSEIFEIKTDFLKLKFQAIQCSLANIRPYPGPEWSVSSCDQFEVLSHCATWRKVWARVVGHVASGVPRVEIIDANQSGTDINIGNELVKQGLAEWEWCEGEDNLGSREN